MNRTPLQSIGDAVGAFFIMLGVFLAATGALYWLERLFPL